jgi:DNA replication protein DnaC
MRRGFELDEFATGRWEEVHRMLDETREWHVDAVMARQVAPTVLVWDDLGSEELRPWMIAKLDRIVEARTARRKMTIVTTNADPKTFRDWRDQEGNAVMGRMWDRWKMTMSWILVGGQSKRRPDTA